MLAGPEGLIHLTTYERSDPQIFPFPDGLPHRRVVRGWKNSSRLVFAAWLVRGVRSALDDHLLGEDSPVSALLLILVDRQGSVVTAPDFHFGRRVRGVIKTRCFLSRVEKLFLERANQTILNTRRSEGVWRPEATPAARSCR